MSLSSVDCLRRGLANLAANWELVLVNWFGNLVLALLVVLGLAPPLWVLGFGLLGGDFSDPRAALAELLERFSASALPLAVSLLGTLAVWLLAFFVFCFVQAGTFGVLVAGERQALPGPPRDRRWFRTFSLRDFSGWGGRYLWRFFGFYNLVGLLALGLLIVLFLWLGLTGYAGQRWGSGAGVGFGCGGALPVVFLVLLLAAWSRLAQADLARDGSGVGRASRTALEVIGRRLGAVILLFVLAIIAAFGLGMLFFPVSLAFDVSLRAQPFTRVAVSFALVLVQWLPAALLNIGLAASLAALIRSEAPRSEAPA
jgi:hypothetical protein